MDDNAAKVIVTALERGLPPPPNADRPYVFLNAAPLQGVPGEWRKAFVCEQGFRPQFLDLRDTGYRVHPVLTGDEARFAGAIVLAGRLRRANEEMIARAWAMLPEGASILVAGANTDGIKSLRKWVTQRTTRGESLSKHHGVAFAIERQGDNPFGVFSKAPTISPAMFSAAAADAGSRLLADFFSAQIGGDVADFGAGSGFLSHELLMHGGKIRRLDAYEADYLSLEAVKMALADKGSEIEKRFFWADLLREPPVEKYDWIIMNPPFHRGRAADPRIGIGFISSASRSLKPGGRLLMVANRQLPYEPALNEHFARATSLAEGAGYKVVEAQVA